MEGKHERPAVERFPTPSYWPGNPEVPFDRKYFDLQLEFARTLSKRSGTPLFDMVSGVAPVVNHGINGYGAHGIPEIIEGVTEENAAAIAYENHLKEIDPHPVPYHDGKRFGCFSHTYDKDRKTAYVHFVNAEYGTPGPLAKERIEYRREELAAVLRDIRTRHPDAELMENRSWLFNIDAFRRLFPKEYLARVMPSVDKTQWRRGTVIWGQFLDSEMKVKEDMANVLLERAHTVSIEPGMTAELLASPLYMPVHVEGPLQDFYDLYDIRD